MELLKQLLGMSHDMGDDGMMDWEDNGEEHDWEDHIDEEPWDDEKEEPYEFDDEGYNIAK